MYNMRCISSLSLIVISILLQSDIKCVQLYIDMVFSRVNVMHYIFIKIEKNRVLHTIISYTNYVWCRYLF